MFPPIQLVRGTVVLARFPFQHLPKQPGPAPHFCLAVDSFTFDGQQLLAIAYGTSRLDEALLQAHEHRVLSVSSLLIRGLNMPGPVTHFVTDHVAIVPVNDDWMERHSGRLDVFKKNHAADPPRRALRAAFDKLYPVMQHAALAALQECEATRLFGLPQGKRLRQP